MRGEPVLVLGAGEAAIALLKDLERSQEWRVIGLLDDNVNIHGREIMGIKVLGEVLQLPEIAKALGVNDVIVAKPCLLYTSRCV